MWSTDLVLIPILANAYDTRWIYRICDLSMQVQYVDTTEQSTRHSDVPDSDVGKEIFRVKGIGNDTSPFSDLDTMIRESRGRNPPVHTYKKRSRMTSASKAYMQVDLALRKDPPKQSPGYGKDRGLTVRPTACQTVFDDLTHMFSASS